MGRPADTLNVPEHPVMSLTSLIINILSSGEALALHPLLLFQLTCRFLVRQEKYQLASLGWVDF